MTKLFGTSALLLAGLIVPPLIANCGGGEDEEIETAPTNFVRSNPMGTERGTFSHNEGVLKGPC